jgi:hypothetical protein
VISDFPVSHDLRWSIIKFTQRVGRGNQNPKRVRLKWQMKLTFLLIALLSPMARAQALPHSMTEKLCDQQGKVYVTEKNKEEPGPEASRSFYWSFVEAHYDAQRNTCYVRYNRFVKGSGTTLQQIKIDDLEGNHVAGYSATWTSDRNGYPTYTRPSECNVNGTSCESKAEFESLLGDFVPSFRKPTPRGRGPVPA